MVSSLVLCACGPSSLRWQVERADRVALQAMPEKSGFVEYMDTEHPQDVLPAGGAPTTVTAPYRNSTVQARRNADGSIELVSNAAVWPLVGADGTVTPLRPDAEELPAKGTAWAFLAPGPGDWKLKRAPWQLRLATPSENVRAARLLVRRDRVMGGVLLGTAAILGAFGSGALYAGGRGDDPGRRDVLLPLGTAAASGAALALGFGLNSLLLREHDVAIARSSPIAR
jgi:hypothetical protein